MKLLFSPLGRPDPPMPELMTSWRKQVAGVQWEIPPDGTERESAIRAIWRGLPFVIAGREKSLDQYCDGLDDDTLEVL